MKSSLNRLRSKIAGMESKAPSRLNRMTDAELAAAIVRLAASVTRRGEVIARLREQLGETAFNDESDARFTRLKARIAEHKIRVHNAV